MPVDEGQSLEARARDGHLAVVAPAGPIDDGQLRRIRKRLVQQLLQGLGRHARHRSPRFLLCAAAWYDPRPLIESGETMKKLALLLGLACVALGALAAGGSASPAVGAPVMTGLHNP